MHFLILFLAIIEISNGQNYIWIRYKEITGTFQESAFQSSLVASDFGPRRVPQYDCVLFNTFTFHNKKLTRLKDSFIEMKSCHVHVFLPNLRPKA